MRNILWLEILIDLGFYFNLCYFSNFNSNSIHLYRVWVKLIWAGVWLIWVNFLFSFFFFSINTLKHIKLIWKWNRKKILSDQEENNCIELNTKSGLFKLCYLFANLLDLIKNFKNTKIHLYFCDKSFFGCRNCVFFSYTECVNKKIFHINKFQFRYFTF